MTGEGDKTGGLVGNSNNPSTIENCYSTVNITGEEQTGGLIGSNSGIISDCYSSGRVTGYSDTGGLVGYNSFYGEINNCYSIGNVTGESYTGGLTGDNCGFIVNCYSTGYVTGCNYIGGLVGCTSQSTITNSIWNIQTSGQTTSAGGIGLTTAQMKTQVTYTDAGWSFPNIWNINPEMNNGYPYLNYPNSVPNDDMTIETPLLTKAVLHSAYPNPFNPSTTISFDLAGTENVCINIFNIKGQLIKNICNKTYDKGNHSIIWDGKDNQGNSCGTGVYFYKMTAGKTRQSKKMMMIK